MEYLIFFLDKITLYVFILSLLHVIYVMIMKIIDIYRIVLQENPLLDVDNKKGKIIGGNLLFFSLAFVIFYFYI